MTDDLPRARPPQGFTVLGSLGVEADGALVLWQFIAGILASSGVVAVLGREYFKYRRLREWFDFHRWAYTQSKDAAVLHQAVQVRDVLGAPSADEPAKALPSVIRGRPRKQAPTAAALGPVSGR